MLHGVEHDHYILIIVYWDFERGKNIITPSCFNPNDIDFSIKEEYNKEIKIELSQEKSEQTEHEADLQFESITLSRSLAVRAIIEPRP